MARLLDWIPGLPVIARERLTGPRSIGASESLEGFVQTVATPFGLRRWQFAFAPMRGRLYRRYGGLVEALHAGANALRVPFCDPDGRTLAESGVDATPEEVRAGVPFSNGASFDNGENFTISPPWAAVATAAAKGDTIVELADENWGHALERGEIGRAHV